ncbi:MAG: hypothetical protein E7203_09415 [Selenomonas ruminantium]|uniref:SGNH hydrolase-type esterase domain-containing protein n=1 Tax=Selenomonas ruminantium TaxID=971 RepID=A0A927ZPI2_SELRU|nr:GDSL-type esterase/lipase family protein [Selenomonas ruminantium]MBE6085647.1 hypothetical protein [Selenomonas ruminantium]
MRYVVDCRHNGKLENQFLELGIWGKPCFAWAIESVMSMRGGEMFTVLTQSAFIRDYCRMHYDNVEICAELPDYEGMTVWISGYAPCLSVDTLRGAMERFEHIGQADCAVVSAANVPAYNHEKDILPLYSGTKLEESNAFAIFKGVGKRKTYLYLVPPQEMVVVNSRNDFELALVLKKKQESGVILEQMIDNIIADKQEILSHSNPDKSICLVGHSQLDQWNIAELGGYKVRNCGISGISSFAYDEKILQQGKLNCEADAFIVMHGTNDIVYEHTLDEITHSIRKNLDYIRRHNGQAPILFMACAHVNGRLDRNNALIDQLNEALRKELISNVEWMELAFLDDQYGHLAEGYTKDGLHLNEEGYAVLQAVVEKKLQELNL